MPNNQLSSLDFLYPQDNTNFNSNTRYGTRNRCSNGNNGNVNNATNCSEAIKESLDLLTTDAFKSFIDLNSFTLIGTNWSTDPDNTTIRSFNNWNDQTINYSDSSGFNLTTCCDIIGFSFNLINSSACCQNDLCQTRIVERFTRLVQDSIPKIDGDLTCSNNGISCNRAKAAYLANSISPVNILVNSNSMMNNALCNLTVITVTDNIAWFIGENTNKIYIFCLNQIVSMG